MIKVLLGIVLAFCIVNYGIDFLFYVTADFILADGMSRTGPQRLKEPRGVG